MANPESPPPSPPAARPRVARAPRRTGLYFGLNAGFLVLVMLGAAVGGNPEPRFLYLIALFALCSGPILYTDALNGRYAILTVLMPLLFLFYGLPDVLRLVPEWGPPPSGLATGVLSIAEVGVLVGLGMLVLGYRFAVNTWRGRPARTAVRDWRRTTLLSLGLALWLVGLLGTWIWQSEVVERYVGTMLGASSAIPLLISRLVQPIGIGLLAYLYVMSRSRPLLILVLAILAIEFVFGFIADSKELAIRSAIIVIVGKYLLEGRIPRQWIIIAGTVVALTFGIFQAYRFEVLQTGKQTRASAAENLSANVDRALNSDMLSGGLVRSSVVSLASRIDLKPTLELVIARVGNDVAYQGGDTLVHIFTSFIPRIIWPDKPDSSVGQLFNREFQVSADPNTYISATHLGELYWNFGWPGVVLGMFAIGFLLGFVNSRFALAEHRSLTRFLVLVTTIYFLCLRFEGSIAIEYIVWMRSLALVAALHFLFASVSPRARRGRAPRPAADADAAPAADDKAAPATARG
jgi:hypothetical protein